MDGLIAVSPRQPLPAIPATAPALLYLPPSLAVAWPSRHGCVLHGACLLYTDVRMSRETGRRKRPRLAPFFKHLRVRKMAVDPSTVLDRKSECRAVHGCTGAATAGC
jgi:hypothetical protein